MFLPREFTQEPGLVIPGRKPVGPVEIDWEHPLAQGIAAYGCVLAGDSIADLVSGQVLDYYSNRGDASADYLRFNDSSRNVEALLLPQITLGGRPQLTYMVHFRFAGTSNAAEDSLGLHWSGLAGTAGAPNRILMRYDSNSNQLDGFVEDTVAGTKSFSATQNIEDGQFHAVALRYDGNTGLSIWADGKRIGQTLFSGGTINTTGTEKVSEVMGGHFCTYNGSDSPRCDLKSYGVWYNAFSDGEMADLTADPYQFLIPRRR